ncbi:MAG: bifunctional glutamate N-acetyltransferase/amino-acid acetyltransferase ArgJ [Devosiaceae bacterium]|nr:bifunctional glutamate N-acetyltransferase/amino-acid acetyltransferase ArgJ [Devosiaceae bacterium MH13]
MPVDPPQPLPVEGVRLASAEAGIKYAGRDDVTLLAFDSGTTVAGVFTRSACASAPVEWCKSILPSGEARALLVNSGNANAFTGMKGAAATGRSAALVEAALGVAPEAVYLASTGVIGEPLDAEKFADVLDGLAANLRADAWAHAAAAIMTTDTYPKVLSTQVEIGGETITLTGMAKGAGMIEPDMATMLSFIATDAAIEAPVLQAMLKGAVDGSFNRITVDSDTSTSDTVLAFATGKRLASQPIEDIADPRAQAFAEALQVLARDLALLVVKDGEGLTKFVTITVAGATTDHSADRVARSIANSPLVKTAFAGEDANWGRVVMAIGKAGEPADRDKVAIWFGDVRVAVQGERDPDYAEEAAAAVMKQPEISLRVDLGLGDGHATVWTCDLTKAYVAINGDYRS